MSADNMPTYDAIVANQVGFDPITLMPMFTPVQTEIKHNGAPINFYVPPPPPAGKTPATGNVWLPIIVGAVTIALLVGIYFLIKRTQ